MKRERWMEGRKDGGEGRERRRRKGQEGRGPSDDLNVVNVQ